MIITEKIIQELRILHNKKIIIFYIFGSIDIHKTIQLEEEIRSYLISYPNYHLVLNLEKTGLISSSGFGIFIKLLREFHEKKMIVKFCNFASENKRILEVMDIRDLIAPYKSEEDCLLSFSNI
jgi:anti-anti-sigma factor